MENNITKLEREIAEKKTELDRLKDLKKHEGRRKAVKELSEYTVEEKVAKFDSFYRDAEATLDAIESGDYHEDNDDAHYTWEAVMGLLARDSATFWGYYNNFLS